MDALGLVVIFLLALAISLSETVGEHPEVWQGREHRPSPAGICHPFRLGPIGKSTDPSPCGVSLRVILGAVRPRHP